MLKRANAILTAVSSFFAGELDRPHPTPLDLRESHCRRRPRDSHSRHLRPQHGILLTILSAMALAVLGQQAGRVSGRSETSPAAPFQKAC